MTAQHCLRFFEKVPKNRRFSWNHQPRTGSFCRRLFDQFSDFFFLENFWETPIVIYLFKNLMRTAGYQVPSSQPPACKLIIDPREAFLENSGYGVGCDQVSNYCQQAEEEDNMGARKIRSLSLLTSNHSTLNDNAVVLAEIARLERRIFPKHESLAGDFSQVQHPSLLFLPSDFRRARENVLRILCFPYFPSF